MCTKSRSFSECLFTRGNKYSTGKIEFVDDEHFPASLSPYMQLICILLARSSTLKLTSFFVSHVAEILISYISNNEMLKLADLLQAIKFRFKRTKPCS